MIPGQSHTQLYLDGQVHRLLHKLQIFRQAIERITFHGLKSIQVSCTLHELCLAKQLVDSTVPCLSVKSIFHQ